MNSYMSRLEKKLQTRVATTEQETGRRSDITLWDHQITGPREARILVSFSGSRGVPKRPDIDQFVVASFNGKLRAMLETVELHDNNLITATVLKIPQVLPGDNPADLGMIRVGVSQWQDQKEAIWDLRETDEGRKFLTRIEAEDLDEILKLRRKETKTASYHKRPRLANLSTVGVSRVEIGDTVSFTHGGSVFEGEVLDINGDRLFIATPDKKVEVLKTAVLNITAISDSDQMLSKEELIRFFTDAYGDRGFATKLVNL